MCVKVLVKMREDSAFDPFWVLCQDTQKELGVNDPVLQWQHKQPRYYDDGIADPHFHEDLKLYYHSIYCRYLDAACATVTGHFQQHDFDKYVDLEQLIKQCLSKDYSDELKVVTDFYHSDLISHS